jgi:UDP-N-acetylglucosamine 4-epimerase
LDERSILKGRRVAVTGAAGFIGSHLAEALLAAGAEVVGLDDFSTGKRENVAALAHNPSFTLLEGDIRDFTVCEKACEGTDFVLHQAALGSVPRSVEHPAETTSVNICGTLNMLLAARDCRVKRFVYASSSSVYGDNPELPRREGAEGRPLSPYAVTKHVNELHGRLFYELYGLETVGLRYFNVFGPRQDPDSPYAAVIPRFMRALVRGARPVIHGDGSQSRDFTYVDNAVRANMLACAAPREACGKAYNIAAGGSVTVLELFEKLRALLGSGIEPAYGAPRPGDVKHSPADISLARKMLGYEPAVGFAEGLERTVGWFLESSK